jgi:NAD(P)-dependent dehydrogenase (short-subunit alcohol dehydrogenase family)
MSQLNAHHGHALVTGASSGIGRDHGPAARDLRGVVAVIYRLNAEMPPNQVPSERAPQQSMHIGRV